VRLAFRWSGVLLMAALSCPSFLLAAEAAPSVSINDVAVTRLDGSPVLAVFTVSLESPSHMPVAVRWETRDGSARAGEDYRASSGTVVIVPGELSARITIPVLPGTSAGVEDFNVVLGQDFQKVDFSDAQGVARIHTPDHPAAETRAAHGKRG
jgi:hypothetical protein